MGGIFTKDTLAEFKVSLLDNEIESMDAAMLILVNNIGQLASITSAKPVQAKRHRILRGAGHLHKIAMIYVMI